VKTGSQNHSAAADIVASCPADQKCDFVPPRICSRPTMPARLVCRVKMRCY